MPEISGFFAYPSSPDLVGDTIERAVEELRSRSGIHSIRTWRETDVAGRFVSEQVLGAIAETECLIADISTLNFNVTYEVGFAIGRGKRLLITRCSAIAGTAKEISELGIFDTLGYSSYQNSDDLVGLLRSIDTLAPLSVGNIQPNRKAPVYLLEAKYKTDSVIRIISRVKKARLFYRSFDPNEHPRLSAHDALQNIAQSYGVLVHLLPKIVDDHRVHNLRASFIAGLAEGMGKVLLFLQDGNEPVPIDYRDLVRTYHHPTQIDEAIGDFATRVTEAWQACSAPLKSSHP